ncbi:Hypothetical predicted protein [Octopus vulgaris]|uniref:Uncharacterized protein n=1 Tax=Octopus vulgaris TaxID=6645 RepID=A0AA36EWS1_OCTVU|nr:Hypothetical predicted protein [Octopus vulgaris]
MQWRMLLIVLLFVSSVGCSISVGVSVVVAIVGFSDGGVSIVAVVVCGSGYGASGGVGGFGVYGEDKVIDVIVVRNVRTCNSAVGASTSVVVVVVSVVAVVSGVGCCDDGVGVSAADVMVVLINKDVGIFPITTDANNYDVYWTIAEIRKNLHKEEPKLKENTEELA